MSGKRPRDETGDPNERQVIRRVEDTPASSTGQAFNPNNTTIAGIMDVDQEVPVQQGVARPTAQVTRNPNAYPYGIGPYGSGGDFGAVPTAPAFGAAILPSRLRRGRRRRKYAGFSRRSFKFLRWLYHHRKRRRFTDAQAQNAMARAVVFRKAWAIAKSPGQGNRKRLTRADVMAAQSQWFIKYLHQTHLRPHIRVDLGH